jgi:hypothetical protein
MKVVLGMIVRNEVPMLTRTAPINSCWPNRLAIDFLSTDGTKQFLEDHGWSVVSCGWPNDFSMARNALIHFAHAYDAIVMLDADECFQPQDVPRITAMLEEHVALGFPRWNLYGENDFVPDHYPDIQRRAFHLNKGCHYINKLHESLISPDPASLAPFHIYHYGWCKPPQATALRCHNYNLISQGLPIVDHFDGDYVFPHKHYPFHAPHPLHPRLVQQQHWDMGKVPEPISREGVLCT